LFALFDHAPEQRRFIELEANPQRDGEQDRRQQKRDSPSPVAKWPFAHSKTVPSEEAKTTRRSSPVMPPVRGAFSAGRSSAMVFMGVNDPYARVFLWRGDYGEVARAAM
jgi:hypothetical protein